MSSNDRLQGGHIAGCATGPEANLKAAAMKPYLLKIALFAGLQLAILAMLRQAGDTQPAPLLAGAPGPLSLDERAEAYLREKLFPIWSESRQSFEALANHPEGHPTLKALAPSYRNGPDNYLAALLDKDERLRAMTGRRLIFVGGSGCAFGLDSILLDERYKLQTANLGLHAALGVNFILNHAKSHVRDGDVVIVCFEHTTLLNDLNSPERRATVSEMSEAYARYFETSSSPDAAQSPETALSFKQRLNDAKYFADKTALAEAATAIRHYRDNLLAQVSSEGAEEKRRREFDEVFEASRERLVAAFLGVEKTAFYRRTNFNEFGDFVGHRSITSLPPKNLDQWTYWIIERIPPAQEKQAVIHIGLINEFATVCEERGATVLFCYPPLIDSPKSAVFAAQYAKLMEQHLKVPILFPIDEMTYDAENFYDTKDHLTWAGTCRRMMTLVSALDEHIEPRTNLAAERQVAERDRAVRGQFSRTAARSESTIH